ncbi:CAP domain-containing protein [Persicimonas caeni]|nr:CAP domain-containing protein [Persicimonas caeni]
MSMNRRLLAALALSTALPFGAWACGSSEAPALQAQPEVEERTLALGLPRDGYPSYSERVVLYLTNRARTEPTAFNPDEPYDPTPPLAFDLNLSKAARFHAQHIIDQNCWCEDHSSCCDMEAAGDEGGQCAGPSGACGATTSSERVGYWSSVYSGENAAKGYPSGQGAVDGWIHSSGHWANINNGGHTLLGPGNYETGWVQDFGAGGGSRPVAADGIHFQNQTNHTFGITYYQPGTGGPQTILAIVDGECHELDLAYGEPEHGAFETSLGLEAGCHRYYFHVTDGDGNEHVYPSQGSFGVAVGATDNCPFYAQNRPADTCSPSGQSCETGHTRPCYTGPWGTEGVGVCEAGVERCIGAQWTGECRLEELPEEAEVCDNGLDDDCNGEVDDGCGGAPDVGGVDAGPTGGAGSSSGGCTSVDARPSPSRVCWALLVGLGSLLAYRRRSSRPAA